MDINIKMMQQLLNKWGFRDYSGNTLIEDGVRGDKTDQARIKAKMVIRLILK